MKLPDWIELETTETRLSVAITLTDAFTTRSPHNPPRVRLEERPETFTHTPSGYFVLTDLPVDVNSVKVVVDGSPHYLPEHRMIENFLTVKDDPDPSYEAEEIELRPSPAYRFPPGTTLIRGSITERNNSTVPLSDIEVTINTDDVSDENAPVFTAAGRSDERGEYVLFVRGITGDDVLEGYDGENRENADRVVHVDGEKPTVRAIHPDGEQERSESVAVPEGKTVRLDFIF